MDVIRLWSTVPIFYMKDKVDSCPAKRHFWFLTIRYFRYLSLDLHLDRVWRSEYRIYSSVTPLYRATYINMCMIVSTHAFHYPRSTILLCLVVIMWCYISLELPYHQLSYNLGIAFAGWLEMNLWSNKQKINKIKIKILTYWSLWWRFYNFGWSHCPNIMEYVADHSKA